MTISMRRLGMGSWQPFQESPASAEDVRMAQSDAAIPFLAFFILLSLSTVIATNGLIADSAATVIGAMIIAPLMQPIGAMAYGLATTDRRLLLRAALTTIAGVVCTIAISYLATLLVGVQTVGREIVGRTAPTALDLVVAVAAGATAAFAATRRSIGDAIPGVAIAVALVPPLCVVGIGLALGSSAIPQVGLVLNQSIALGSFLLFSANLAGIVFSGALVYVVQGYGRLTHALRGMVISILVIAGLAYPLWFALDELVVKQNVHRHLVEIRSERPEVFRNMVMRRLDVEVIDDTIFVDVEAICPRDLEFNASLETERIRQELAKRLGREVELKLAIILADVFETKLSAGSDESSYSEAP